MRILLLGFGNLGRAFCELVQSKSGFLEESLGIKCRFTGIATRSRGCVAESAGIDVRHLLEKDL